MTRILFKTKGKTHLLNVNEVLYCKAAGSYSVIYLFSDEHIVISSNLLTLHNKFKEHLNMARVGQSFLVNIEYIKCIFHSSKEIILSTGVTIPYTLSFKELEKELNIYLKQ